MITGKSSINLLFICIITFLVGCVADSTKKEEVATTPEIVNRLIGNNISPADFPARTQSIITLDYTSIDQELASSCSLSQLDRVTETQACSCTAAGVCSVGITGVGAYSGGAGFSFNVVAGGKTSTTGRAVFNLLAPPAGSNEAPTITSIGAQSTTENAAVSSIPFTIGDNDSVVSCSNVTAVSSNTTVLPNANVVISGSGTSCYVTVTPATNQIGSSNVTLTLTDTGTPLPAKTATTMFALTVTAFNDPPTISTIATQVTNEDTATTAIAFTIGDVDSSVSCSNVTATSSNTSLVSNASVVIGGAGTNCTVTATPTLNQSGSTNITIVVTDNGSPMPAKTASRSFALVVASVNDVPAIAAIANQNTTQNVATVVNFTITDVDSNLSCGSSVGITSSNTTVLPNTNISIGGIAPNCTATLTPASNQSGSSTITVTVSDNGFPMPVQTTTANFVFMVAQVNQAPTISSIANQTTNEDTATSAIAFTIADSDSTVYCSNVAGTSSNTAAVPNASIVISGTAPNCTAVITPSANAYGSSTITLTLTDNGTPTPALTATTVFNLTINATNDAPVISAITNKSTNLGTPSAAITFNISDVDSTVSCTSGVAMTSTNTTLIPNANVVFSGTAPNCSAVVTPAGTNFGTSTLTFTVTDNGTPLPALTAASSFLMTVNQINQAPQISAITNKTTNEDTATTAIAFTIVDSDSTIYCSNVTGVSSNLTLVPNANIVITGTAPNCNAVITPTANNSGSATITLTVTDNGTPTPVMTANSVFVLSVTAVNDVPTISAITAKTTNEDTASSAITFTTADVDSTISCNGNVTGSSSNTALIPNANIVVSGTVPNCSAVITPSTNQNGSATITLTVTDNGTPMPAGTASTTFSMSVSPVPDISGTLTLAANLSGVASSFSGNVYGRTMLFTGITSDESLSTFELCLGTASGSCDISSWVEATGYTTSGSAPTVSLAGSYRIKSGIGGAQVFTLTPSCSTTTDYYYSVRATNTTTKISNILSTPAWSFWEPTCLGVGTLSQWLDASEPSTMTHVTGVSSWTDKSGNGNSVTQATTTKQPIFQATGMGTLPSVRFNGTSSSMTGTGFVYAQGSATIFTAIKAATVAANRFVFSEAGSATNTTYYSPMVTSTTSTLTGVALGNVAGTPQLNFPASSSIFFNNTIKLGMAIDGGNTFTTYSDGTIQSQATTNYTRATSTINTFRLGAKLVRTTESLWFAGDIGEFMVLRSGLTTTQRQKLEGYSAHKWGVIANLPGAHPYKTIAP